MSAVDQLLGLIDSADPVAESGLDVLALQVQAANEHLAERRATIPALERIAADADVTEIKSFEDLLPLLFSHTTYKTYPEAFIRNGRWDRLLQWYGTLTTASTDAVDLVGVHDIDGWMERLWDAGLYAYASSGTSGKCSFLPAVQADRDLIRRFQRHQLPWFGAAPPAQNLRWYQLMERRGYRRAIDNYRLMAGLYARPDEIICMTEGPLLVSEVNAVGAMRKAIIEGSATPANIAAFEADSVRLGREAQERLETITRDIIGHQDKPMAVMGLWAELWEVVQIGKTLGVERLQLLPESVVWGAGGTKGAVLPAGYEDQIYAFFGATVRPRIYGMTELIGHFPQCEAGRYHPLPWIAVLVLDQTGERLLNAEAGEVTGRAAFFDVATQGRWGGLVTGDRVSVDFAGCACGRPGPTISATVVRYSELEGGDDKLTCAGTMDAYVRGIVGA